MAGVMVVRSLHSEWAVDAGMWFDTGRRVRRPALTTTGRVGEVRAEEAGLKAGPIRQARFEAGPIRQAQGRFYAGGDASWENGGGHICGTEVTA